LKSSKATSQTAPPDFLARVTDALVPALKANAISRVVYLASAGIDKEIPGIAGTVVTFMLRKPLRDHRAAVDLWRKQISRADVAQFMLNAVEDQLFIRQSVGLAY